MNEELQTQAVRVFSLIADGIEAGVAELPSIANELIMWARVERSTYFLIWLGLAVYMSRYAFNLKKLYHTIYKVTDDECPSFFGCAAIFCGFLFPVFIAFQKLGGVAKVWLAPRVWLFDYVKGMLG